MIAGVGVDLVSVERMHAILQRHGRRARRRLFTARELAECDARTHPAECLAARFAAKEAGLKALGCGKVAGTRWTDLEILRDPGSGAPRLEFSGATAKRAARRDVGRIWVSLTHDGGIACALVVLENANA